MPCAATVLANSTVYYKGNKEPWDWLVRQFIYILCSIFICFRMINSAGAAPPGRACSQPGAAAPGAALAGRGCSGARGLPGLLRPGSRFPSGAAACGWALRCRGLCPARRTTRGKAHSQPCSQARPSGKFCRHSLPFISIMYIHLDQPRENTVGFVFFLNASPPRAKHVQAHIKSHIKMD